jgi:hypothetical protein
MLLFLSVPVSAIISEGKMLDDIIKEKSETMHGVPKMLPKMVECLENSPFPGLQWTYFKGDSLE